MTKVLIHKLMLQVLCSILKLDFVIKTFDVLFCA